jgi:phosphoglycerate dehydrogenase-like enzyme
VFRVGVTHDILGSDGRPVYDLSLLDESAEVDWQVMREHGDELAPDDVAGYDAIVLFHPIVSAQTLSGKRVPRLIARLGVGLDNVDVAACTERGVLVTVTPDSVRRPLAAGTMAFVLALAHRLPEMDRHLRTGGFDRFAHVGIGLRGRTLGIVGIGNVGRELVELARPFGLRLLAADPYADPGALPAGVELVELDELLGRADFVVVLCPLTDETKGLLDASRLARMRSGAFLVNVARGPIVDQGALVAALLEGRIAGAALDVFEREPVDPRDPLLSLDNVILSPHGLALTDELFREGGHSVARSVLAVAAGRLPEFAVNPEALERRETA